jgi:hypothetical protein
MGGSPRAALAVNLTQIVAMSIYFATAPSCCNRATQSSVAKTAPSALETRISQIAPQERREVSLHPPE